MNIPTDVHAQADGEKQGHTASQVQESCWASRGGREAEVAPESYIDRFDSHDRSVLPAQRERLQFRSDLRGVVGMGEPQVGHRGDSGTSVVRSTDRSPRPEVLVYVGRVVAKRNLGWLECRCARCTEVRERMHREVPIST